MPRTDPRRDESAALVRRLVGGDPGARERVLAAAAASTSASLLAAAAMLARDPHLATRAAALAATPRERQLTALVGAHLRGETSLFNALVREHLSEHPDHLLAAWIAGLSA